ncbi:hypothetical protein RZD54_004201 [Citrobacter freundii]|uniref:hypothetical protein n=1 Tax=Citrobacter freundii TaxID=546 RepID=UPI0008FD26A4|nr:hypothetical protein [Citrobacter freundii]EKW7212019.1 hypothetical protein [Citrobacter freundii]ELO0988774.1 hypothetical protein [Citrobacter freundii]MDE8800886.1 hypothetical protein [Citrobacter freundii]MDE8806012.1 hypothetical protein [Citrobacter freundii]OIZ41406.1 hypothetical protein BEH73_22730 [Citrobacter freundii]
MLRLRKILLRGDNVHDAYVEFDSGANILAGESDTGKSYLISCLDYILGAEQLKKKPKEAAAYTDLFVEFENSKNEVLTLTRALDGGKLLAYYSPILSIDGKGETIAPLRKGTSKGPDVTSILFSFAGIKDAKLRKNARGETQRLSIRTLSPIFLVDEVSIIDEFSPITGRPGFDDTARKRMFSYILTGIGDDGIATGEKSEIIKARLHAKLEVVQEMIQPLEERFGNVSYTPPSELELDDVIVRLTGEVKRATDAISFIHQEMQAETAITLKAESQLLGVAEIQLRYSLLKERYYSDLKRLDFLVEGSHYFASLQEIPCTLCGQNLTHQHYHSESTQKVMSSEAIRSSATAESAKIHAYLVDLQKAISSVDQRKGVLEHKKENAQTTLAALHEDLKANLAPIMTRAVEHLEEILDRRAERDAENTDFQRWSELHKLQSEIQQSLTNSSQPKQEWSRLSSKSLANLCTEIEEILIDWKWSSKPRVSFDEKEYDIIVDGQPRQSHGKGVRAILYSAFIIGLLKYCVKNGMPHLGLVVIDSPLTSFKKKGAAKISGSNEPISAGVETGFWHSLAQLPKTMQVIVIENKEPPTTIISEVHYEWFAGEYAGENERAALIPLPKEHFIIT